MSLWKFAWQAFSRSSAPADAHFCNEDELLLCAARPRTNPETAARMRSLLQDEMDWERLIAAAHRHGLATLLYRRLHSGCAGGVPKSVLLKLGRRFVLNIARNQAMTAELVRVLALFNSHGIRALTFKGPLLSQAIYGDSALREFEDLDILVPESEFAKAQNLLDGDGYRALTELPPERAASYRRMQHEIVYKHPRRSILIDLHWRTAPAFSGLSMEMPELWMRSESTSLSGSRVRTLSKEDALLVLCAHGSRHLWKKLQWVADIAGLIGVKQEMNWEFVFDRARCLGSERVLLLGLLVAQNLCGADIPEPARQRIRQDEILCTLAAEARRRLFIPNSRRPADLLQECFETASLTDRWRDGFRMFVTRLLLPRHHDWIWFKLPAHLSFLYYPIRIFRLLKEYALPAA